MPLYEQFNAFDIAILTIVSLSTLIAFFRGFIRSILSLINWVVAFVGTGFLFPHVDDLLSDKIDSKLMLLAISSIGLFIAVFVIIAIINGMILSTIKEQTKGWMDRSVGFVFGLVRGTLIAVLIFFTVNLVASALTGEGGEKKISWLVDAKTYPILADITAEILPLLPEEVNGRLKETVATNLERMQPKVEKHIMEQVTLTRTQKNQLTELLTHLTPEEKKALMEGIDPSNMTPEQHKGLLDRLLKLRQEKQKEAPLNDAPVQTMDTIEDVLEETQKQESGYDEKSQQQMDRLINNVAQ